MFRIMKRGSCFFGQRVSSCPFTSSVYLRRGKADDSEPKGPFCGLAWSVGLKEWGNNKGHPQRTGGLGVAKIWTNPGEVKGLGPRQCNCGDVMKKIANAPSYSCTISIHYTARTGVSPPCSELSARLLSLTGMKMDGRENHMLLTQNERDSTAFNGRRDQI